jgi:hypothetical protein
MSRPLVGKSILTPFLSIVGALDDDFGARGRHHGE